MPRPPSDGRVTAPYGPRTHRPTPTSPLFHFGEDTIGYGNVSPVDGTIVYASYAGALGNTVGIRETANPSVIWWFSHCRTLAGVVVGRVVKEGQFVAPIGTTGNSTGIHVHTERRVGGAPFPQSGTHTNPRAFYGGTVPADDTDPITIEPVQEDDMSYRMFYAHVPEGVRYVVVDELTRKVREDFTRTKDNMDWANNRAELYVGMAGRAVLRTESALRWTLEEYAKDEINLPRAVWSFPVHRGTGPVMAIQELANASTAAQSADAILREGVPTSGAAVDGKKISQDAAAETVKQIRAMVLGFK